MPRSTEKLALRLMESLKAELDREPDAAKARPVVEVAARIFKSHEEFDRVVTFVGPQRMALINSWRRDGRLVAQPNKAGLAWIEDRKTPLTLQRLSWIVGIILAIAAFAWGVFVWLHPPR
jgi:hypothetical protein